MTTNFKYFGEYRDWNARGLQGYRDSTAGGYLGDRTAVIRNSGAIVNHLGQLFSRGTASGLGERDLLDRFLDGNDEVAFAAIVAQHGPMVLGVCRRLLHDQHEIEDAFQATFLVFVRRAGTIRG